MTTYRPFAHEPAFANQDLLLERAAQAGFELVTRVTDTGQVV